MPARRWHSQMPEGVQHAEPPLLATTLPSLSHELHELLLAKDESELAAQVPQLRIVARCRCGEDSFATFYVLPKPKGSYGPGHRNVVLDPIEGMLILDVVGGKIACVEVLDREEVRQALAAALP